jgi:hypothetical protein
LNYRHGITNFCSHYCYCRTFELLFLLWLFWKQLKKKYVGKMSTTKMSYL